MENSQAASYLPFAIYCIATLLMVVVMLVLSYFLGQRHMRSSADTTFESGIAITGTARLRFAASFYLIAMFFVIFDLEAIFLFAWALVVRQTGWTGYIAVFIFVAMLFAALLYIWRTGGLSFGRRWYHGASSGENGETS